MELIITKRTDPNLLVCMKNHYSKPKGFVGRNICYAIYHEGIYYGHIVGGSATRFLPGRDEFLSIKALDHLNLIVNNIFFHINRVNNHYPMRNFVQKVVLLWEMQIQIDWKEKYGDIVIALESLVQPPRTGEVYKRCGWSLVGKTKGYTCKRVAGKGTDSWSGKRVWNTEDLQPKLVFMKRIEL